MRLPKLGKINPLYAALALGALFLVVKKGGGGVGARIGKRPMRAGGGDAFGGMMQSYTRDVGLALQAESATKGFVGRKHDATDTHSVIAGDSLQQSGESEGYDGGGGWEQGNGQN